MILQTKLGHPQRKEVIPVSSGCSSNYLGKTEHIHSEWGVLAPWIPGNLLDKELLLAETQDPRKESILKLCLHMVPGVPSESSLGS